MYPSNTCDGLRNAVELGRMIARAASPPPVRSTTEDTQTVAAKTIVKFPVEDVQAKAASYIPVGIADGARPGRSVAVIGGVHGTEYSALEGVRRFWDWLNPAGLSGRVMVVLAADVTAVTARSAYVNPVDGKNLNRAWPGRADGTLTDVIAHTITREVISQADVVLDSHGGEWIESIDLFVLTHTTGDQALDARAMDLAMAVGMPFVEILDGVVMCSAEAMKQGKPAVTLEAGGKGVRDERHIQATFNCLLNALRHLEVIPGAPVPWAGRPAMVRHSHRMTSSASGLFVPHVSAGAWVAEGALLAEVQDFDGNALAEIRAPESGIILDIITAHAISAGAFAVKVSVV